MDSTNEPRSDHETRRVRIGDDERDEVISALQEHLAAGRLDVDEYEQRAERVVAARYAGDLDALLDDLPPTKAQQQREQRRGRHAPSWRGRPPVAVPLLVALAVIAIIALPGPPLLLFPLVWVALFFAFARGRWGWNRWDDSAPCTNRQQAA